MAKQTPARKPPYGSFKTSRSFVEKLKKTVVPDHIDRGMMTWMSGDSQTETLSGFRFLGLLGEQDSAEDALKSLVDSFGTDAWAATLGKVITTAYAAIIGDLKISTASAKMLSDKFRAAGVDGFMQARSIRFYLAALKEAEISYSPLLKPPTPKKSSSPKKPVRKGAGGKGTTKGTTSEGGKTPAGVADGYVEIPLPPGRKFVFPADINCSDVTMITAVLSAYAARRQDEETET